MKKYFLFLTIIFTLCISPSIFFSGTLFAQEQEKNQDDKKEEEKKEKKEKHTGDVIIEKVLVDPLEKILPEKEYYKRKKVDKKEKRGMSETENDTDISSIRKSASKELKNFLVLITEFHQQKDPPIVAPIFLSDYDNIFGTRTDFSLKWLGFKLKCKFSQRKFPFKNTTLEETLIGSFLFASGTNLGFIGNRLQEETRFFTNYTSQILILKWNISKYLTMGGGVGTRQYFFMKRDIPPGFTMPRNHINIFPRGLIDIGYYTEKGMDQLTEGVKLSSWAGYGIRSNWDQWGVAGNMQSGKKQAKFLIYSTTLITGILFNDNHNIVLRSRFKGGLNNDFLSKPRFGGTIDNAYLDVVHGFAFEKFRVFRFGITNLRYGVNLFSRLRLNLYCDYAHIFSDYRAHLLGFGYGFRIRGPYNLPLWFTHGIGLYYDSDEQRREQSFLVMTAAGW
ncbi:MAG: hypothetical protein GY754_27065 [bacterium]|nr:hypothetical protein [bacterium]